LKRREDGETETAAGVEACVFELLVYLLRAEQ